MSLNPLPPCHRHAPAGTSEVAADRIRSKTPTMREQVLAFIRSRGTRGCTDEEGQLALGMKTQTYVPRRLELVRLGLVRDTGHRRPTSSNRLAAVYVDAALGDGTLF